MRLLSLYLTVCLGIVVASVASTHAKDSDVLLRARVLQLESQLRQVTSESAVCNARLAMTVRAQSERDDQQARTQLEHEAGCAIDWMASPPVCKATVQKEPPSP
jgi:hypothetical protein